MFKLIRLVVFCMIAFVAGVFFERSNQKELCETSGGNWARAGVCAFEVQNDG